MYPQITYSSGDEYHFSRRVLEPRSFILSAALDIKGFRERGNALNGLPYYEELEIERLPRMRQETIFSRRGEPIDVEEVEEEKVVYVCRFDVAEVRQHPEKYGELLDELNDDKFVFKKQYHIAQRYLKELAAKQKTENDILLDLL